jgi:hypothetical protein
VLGVGMVTSDPIADWRRVGVTIWQLRRELERPPLPGPTKSVSAIGRKSGRTISIPVWFVLENDKLCLLPVQGSESVVAECAQVPEDSD